MSNILKALDESLADEFMKMAKEKGFNVRKAGTPEQERERTEKMLAQRQKDREMEPPKTYGDDEISKWKQELEKAKEGFDSNYDYSDDHSYWSEQRDKAKLIKHYTDLLKQAGVEIDESKEADYGKEYQDMVQRVGDRAKQGPLKTVWDPVKRLYKNVPVSQEKEKTQSAISKGISEDDSLVTETEEDCHVCRGTGEGRHEHENCWNCHGTGIEPTATDDDDFDFPETDTDGDYEEPESGYERYVRTNNLEEGWREETQELEDWAKEVNTRLYRAHESQRSALARQLSQIEHKQFGSQIKTFPNGQPGYTQIVANALQALNSGRMQHYDPERVGEMPFGYLVGDEARAIARAGLDANELNGYNKLKQKGIVDNLDDFLRLYTVVQEQPMSKVARYDYQDPTIWVKIARDLGWSKDDPPNKVYHLPEGTLHNNEVESMMEVSDETLIGYLNKVEQDARKHKMDPTKRSPEKANRSVMGFNRAFNKLDARKATDMAKRVGETETDESMNYQDYEKKAEELHNLMMLASKNNDVSEFERLKKERSKLDSEARKGLVAENDISTDEKRLKYIQAAKDVLKGADFDHLARVRNLDSEILRKFVSYAWDKLNSGEYKLNRPDLEEGVAEGNVEKTATGLKHTRDYEYPITKGREFNKDPDRLSKTQTGILDKALGVSWTPTNKRKEITGDQTGVAEGSQPNDIEVYHLTGPNADKKSQALAKKLGSEYGHFRHDMADKYDNLHVVTQKRYFPDYAKQQGVAEETGDEKFDTMMGNIVKGAQPTIGSKIAKPFKAAAQAVKTKFTKSQYLSLAKKYDKLSMAEWEKATDYDFADPERFQYEEKAMMYDDSSRYLQMMAGKYKYNPKFARTTLQKNPELAKYGPVEEVEEGVAVDESFDDVNPSGPGMYATEKTLPVTSVGNKENQFRGAMAESMSFEESFNMKINELEMMNEDWQKVNRKDKTSGMSKKAVKAYRRENPGSKLQTAVTTKPSKLKKGSKSAKRRASFCARMKGMKKHRTGAKTKSDPNSNINKALRRWHCESVEEMKNLIMIAEQKISEAKNLKQQAAIAVNMKKAGKTPKK